MEYYNLIFAVFYLWRLAITTIDKQSCFYYNMRYMGQTDKTMQS